MSCYRKFKGLFLLFCGVIMLVGAVVAALNNDAVVAAEDRIPVVTAAELSEEISYMEPEAPAVCAISVVIEEMEMEVPKSDADSNVYSEVPLYFQNDYPNTPYGHGTIATSGCGITCLAMVASYLTDTECLPDELAGRFGSYSASNMERMEYASNSLDIPPYEKIYDWPYVVDALLHDKIVIVMMNERSVFTNSQHFIVLTDITEDGKIKVNDPNEYSYSVWSLKDGFKNGFLQETISIGFCGGWAYDKSEMPNYTATSKTSEDISTVDPIEETGEITESSDSVPLYFQTDYPDVRYGHGTIATSGCSITSLAMVATYLTGHPYMPDELADYFAEFNGNHMERLEYGSDFLQLPWKKAENFHVMMKALREGKVVIALMNQNSLFTNGQHFIVLTGINENRKIMVNDPNEANYSLWNLKKAFINGFSESDIMAGYSGAWIYDKSAMPEEPFIYVEEKVYVEPRYTDIVLMDEEIELLARMVWCEAQGECFDGQQAVAEVVLNRLYSGDFQGSVYRIIYAEDQFASVPYLDDAKPTQTQYEAVERALYGPYVLPIDVVYFSRHPMNDQIWGKIGGHTFCYQEDFDGES